MNRRRFLAQATLAGLAAGLGCSPGKDSRQLTVGMELESPPFETRDAQGKPAGVSVDLATELAVALNRELVIENIAFDGLIASLKTGRIDLILSSMTRTDERAQSIDFSDPYVDTGLSLLVGRGSAVKSILNLDQPGRRVAVKKGTTGHAYAVAKLKRPEVLVLDKEAAAVLEVAQGKADAFIYDQISVLHLWERNRETTQALLDAFQKEQWAIGVRKGNGELLKQVNGFLAEFRRSGGFDRLGDRWLGDEKAAFRKMGVAFIF